MVWVSQPDLNQYDIMLCYARSENLLVQSGQSFILKRNTFCPIGV